MTHLCSRCDRFIRETCPGCGAGSTRAGSPQAISTNTAGHPIPGTDFLCSACGLRFPMGKGGEVLDVCQQCTARAE